MASKAQGLITEQTYIFSDRKNAVYTSEDVINFTIPKSKCAIIDTKNCYFVFTIKFTGNQFKGSVCPSAGAYSLFRAITIHDGNGSTAIETLNNYAVLQAVKYNVEKLETTENLYQLHEGKPSSIVCGDTTLNQYCNGTKNDGEHFNTLKVTLPLYLSGLFNPTNPHFTHTLLTRGFRLQVELNDWESMFKSAEAPLYKLDSGMNMATGESGGYSEEEGYAVKAQVNEGDLEILLKNNNDTLGKDMDRCLSGNVAKPSHIFCPEQYIYVKDASNVSRKLQINSIEMSGNNIKLTVKKNDFNEKINENASVWVSHEHSDYAKMGVEISSVKMNVSTIVPTPQYLDEVAKALNSNKAKYDIVTYTDLPKNIADSSTVNSLVLNCVNKRAKSILCVPVNALSSDPTTDTFKPVKHELKSYNFVLAQGLVPDRNVPLERYNSGGYDPVCLREQMMAVGACGWEMNNVKDIHDNFFIGRRLALRGYSFDCQKQVEVNVNYNTIGPVMMHCFVVHKRQVISDDNQTAVVL